MQKNNTYKT